MKDFIGRPHDFDFLVGRWHSVNRRLKQRHIGSDDWHEFEATSEAAVHLGGQVSIDEIHFPSEGFSGFTVRTLELATQQWAIYWINSRKGELFTPVRGGWAGDRGEFYGDDEDEGRPIQVRFIWLRQGPDKAHWEQAFSTNDGRTWETNWTMDFRRLA